MGRQQPVRDAADRASQHGADEQAGTENAARIARAITGRDRHKFKHHQQSHQLEGHTVIEDFADISITNAQHLRDKPAHQTHQQSARGRLEPERFHRQAQESLPHHQQELGERHRHQASGHSEHRINPKLQGMNQLVLRHFEKRVVAQKQAQGQPGRCGGQDRRSHHRRVQIADNLLQREHHRGQRRVKRGRNGRGCASGYQLLYLLGAQSQVAAQHRGDAASDLH